MQTLRFSISINAPRERVWDVMLGDATYREWTGVFMPGSHYKGSWEKGSEIQFLGPDPETGTEGGMFSEIAEIRPREFVSIRHLGEIRNGVEEPYGADRIGYENYALSDKDGGTEVSVDMINVPDEYAPMFEESWPKALEKIKEIAER